MKIDAFTRLLYPSVPAYRTSSTQNLADSAQSERARAAVASSGQKVEKGNIESGDESRRQRVAELKQAVSQGTYRPKSEDVALAVARELFA